MSRDVVLETLQGIGRIHSKGVLVVDSVRYAITVSQRMLRVSNLSGPAGEISGLGSIDGRILGDVPFRLIGESIELELEDGRRWKCFIQSTDGTLVNMGGIA